MERRRLEFLKVTRNEKGENIVSRAMTRGEGERSEANSYFTVMSLDSYLTWVYLPVYAW